MGKGIMVARGAALRGHPNQPVKRQLLVCEPTRKLNRVERRRITRQLQVPLSRRTIQQFTRLVDPTTNQHRMEVIAMKMASAQARKARKEAELLQDIRGEEAA